MLDLHSNEDLLRACPTWVSFVCHLHDIIYVSRHTARVLWCAHSVHYSRMVRGDVSGDSRSSVAPQDFGKYKIFARHLRDAQIMPKAL